ncbi:MAG: lytic transglycosylase domain-containing protein [Bacteroidota bacterium]
MLKFLSGLIPVIAIGSFIFFSSYSNKAEEEKNTATQEEEIVEEDRGSLPQIIKSVDMDKGWNFAGEAIPKENFDAMERLERELSVNSYWHSSTLLNIKNANRYFPIMEPILAENGVPDDFKYLAVAESSLRNATSPSGAKGIWQFLKGTGAANGLEINSQIDERYHVEKATKAACKYLKGYKERFGSWTLAAAAYNMGGTNTSKFLRDQKAKTYYDLNVNQETSRYVFRIVAIKEILSNPEEFGFYLDRSELYQPLNNYKIVEVNGPVSSWGAFAEENGTTYRMLKVYNPWLVSSSLTNSGKKKYEVKIPL